MLQGYLEYSTRKGVSHAAEVLRPLRALRKPCAPQKTDAQGSSATTVSSINTKPKGACSPS